MTCEYCLVADAKPQTGLFMSGCPECQARMLAYRPEFYEAQRAGEMTPAYRDALQTTFGEDWTAAHLRVKHWAVVLGRSA